MPDLPLPASGYDSAGESSKILLDSPAESPALGYGDIGRGLATVISNSAPQFALGIFGGWGTGKTTLMASIKAALPPDSVVVDFNAWRYEREPQLLLPLLDTIRAELVRWSAARDQDTRRKVRKIAERVGRVVRALAAGLSAEIGLPGAAKVSYDLGEALELLGAEVEPDQAQSLYLAAFEELSAGFGELAAGDVSRVIVFVDDLDRCLPPNALEVLEAIKLFFDLPGFIFVVGLDESILDRAIRAKFMNAAGRADDSEDPATPKAWTRQLSRDYVKKIFQVSYTLPPMMPQDLDDLLISMYAEAALGQPQYEDLQQRVRPYLRYIAVQRRVNPREVKRFVNAYTLQTLVRPSLERDTILALQTLAFRDEWASLYGALVADPDMFVEMLSRYRNDENEDAAFTELLPELALLPHSLASYLRSRLARPLLDAASLDPYISSLQSTHITWAWIPETYRRIGKLLRQIRAALGDELAPATDMAVIGSDATVMVSGVYNMLADSTRPEDVVRLESALEDVQRLANSTELSGETDGPERAADLRSQLTDMAGAIQRVQRELQSIREYGWL